MAENILKACKNRLLQILAMNGPGGASLRAKLHRWRGVTIGSNVWIGYQALLETSYPHLIKIGSNCSIGIRTTFIGHFRDMTEPDENGHTIRVEDDVFIGPGVIVLPNVTIGKGAVVTAGSVVTRSVPPMTMVRGNPAKPIARCGIPLGRNSVKSFSAQRLPLDSSQKDNNS